MRERGERKLEKVRRERGGERERDIGEREGKGV